MPGSERYRQLDLARRVAASPDTKATLFRRAAVEDEYLEFLSEAGILKPRGAPITNCVLAHDSGELVCAHRGKQPPEDCRQAACPYAAIMRMRLRNRLRLAYARERKRLVGR